MAEKEDEDIPIIDLSQDEAMVVDALMKAFTTIGFATLKNHGAEPAKIQKAFEASKSFFALDDEDNNIKAKYKFQGHKSNRGYIGIGLETHDLEADNTTADHKETFDIGKEDEPGYQNLWPTELLESTTFRQDLLDYFQTMDKLYLRLMGMIEIGLKLPKDFLVNRCNAQHENLRLLHYPSLTTPRVRGNVHTDFGTLTLLVQDQVGGLKVRRKDGSWICVKPAADAVIVNVGDMLMRWSNDRLKATLHQVVPPPGGADGKIPERFSIAFFCNANKDATIECLESCCSADGYEPPRYPPINAHEYLTKRLMDTINQ
jgi:isopenicillin N synthase-like dioxygenase